MRLEEKGKADAAGSQRFDNLEKAAVLKTENVSIAIVGLFGDLEDVFVDELETQSLLKTDSKDKEPQQIYINFLRGKVLILKINKY